MDDKSDSRGATILPKLNSNENYGSKKWHVTAPPKQDLIVRFSFLTQPEADIHKKCANFESETVSLLCSFIKEFGMRIFFLYELVTLKMIKLLTCFTFWILWVNAQDKYGAMGTLLFSRWTVFPNRMFSNCVHFKLRKKKKAMPWTGRPPPPGRVLG